MSILNEVIADTDNDIGRLRQGREISRPRKKKDVKNDDYRLHATKTPRWNLQPVAIFEINKQLNP